MKVLIRILPVLLACGCGPEDSARNPPPGRWLTADEVSFDFGDVSHGDRPFHDFRIRNRSKQRIVLRGYRNACSCTRVAFAVLDAGGRPLRRKIYDPPERIEGDYRITWLEGGEILRVRVEVLTGLRPPEDHFEPGTTELYFQPEAEVGTLRLAYRFHIRPRVLVHPTPTISLGRLGKDQKGLAVLELTPGFRRGPFRILGIEGTDEVLKLEETEPKLDGGHRYLIRFGPAGRTGPFHRELRFRTDMDEDVLGGGYVAKVQVHADLLPNLEFFPFRRIDLSRFPFTESRRSFLTLIYHGSREDPGFEVVGVRAEVDGAREVGNRFRAWIDGGEDRRWRLHLEYLGGVTGRRILGRIILSSKDPDHPRSTVPFTAFHAGP